MTELAIRACPVLTGSGIENHTNSQ